MPASCSRRATASALRLTASAGNAGLDTLGIRTRDSRSARSAGKASWTRVRRSSVPGAGRVLGRAEARSFFLPPAAAASPEGRDRAVRAVRAALVALGLPGAPEEPKKAVTVVVDDSAVGTAVAVLLATAAVLLAPEGQRTTMLSGRA